MTHIFENIDYTALNSFQVGRIGEYWVKICLTLLGLDVYTTEVDDKGIDFVVRINDNKLIDIQVKTIREKTSYVYVNKETKTWKMLRENLYLALVILKNNNIPLIYLIQSTEWNTPNKLIKDYNYLKKGLKSKPDWGLNISKKNEELLKKYELTKIIEEIKA